MSASTTDTTATLEFTHNNRKIVLIGEGADRNGAIDDLDFQYNMGEFGWAVFNRAA